MPKKKHDSITDNWFCSAPGTAVASVTSVSLASIIKSLEVSVLVGDPEACSINQVSNDSRNVGDGSLFTALVGSSVDGHDFIGEAVANNCSALLIQAGCVDVLRCEDDICIIEVQDSRNAFGLLAEELFSYPAKDMTMLAVTGTNGKTTISYLLETILQHGGKRVGVLGTIDYRYTDINGELHCIPSSFTTPEPMLLQQVLREMTDNGVETVIMEVSSHALEQTRLGNIVFDIAAFTNLSRDHLDYHGTMEDYFSAKSLLFTQHLKDGATAIITFDGAGLEWSEELRKLCLASNYSVSSCGRHSDSDIYPLEVTGNLKETKIQLYTPDGECEIVTSLVGDFNVANIQTSFAMARATGLVNSTIVDALQTAIGAPGRMQRIVASTEEDHFRPTVFVDYAHTPDALEQALKTLKALPHSNLYCVFGCGGERDTGKRPLMGAVAGKYADVVVLTDDNPRTEESSTILSAIAGGVQQSSCKSYKQPWLFARKENERGCVVLAERHLAITEAITAAEHDDIVLIAGKGHETYQRTPNGSRFFDDRLEAKEALVTWSLKSLVAATKGKLLEKTKCICVLGSIQTDSRTIRKNDIFVALRGERFDAHDYLEQVITAGASCLIVERVPEFQVSIPVIRVANTARALGDLASYRRAQMKDISCPDVIGITGSSGKTTVKEMCAAIFNEQWPEQIDAPSRRVLKTEGNFNNLIGLPLSLLPVAPKHTTVILEMGMNSPGEIKTLTEIADPDIACIVNIHGAHLLGLGTIEGVAKAKEELFESCGEDTVLVINSDNSRVMKCAEKYKQNKLYFGLDKDADQLNTVYTSKREDSFNEELHFTLHVEKQYAPIKLQVPGLHNIQNSLAAATIAHAAGIDIEVIAKGLSTFVPADRRMQILDGPRGSRIINDTYNANPESMKAGITTLSELGSGRRIAVLGDMFELGADSDTLHTEIGKHVAGSNIDFLGVIGDSATFTAAGAMEAGMTEDTIHVFKDSITCEAWLQTMTTEGIIGQGTYILVKASRGMHLDKLVEQLMGT